MAIEIGRTPTLEPSAIPSMAPTAGICNSSNDTNWPYCNNSESQHDSTNTPSFVLKAPRALNQTVVPTHSRKAVRRQHGAYLAHNLSAYLAHNLSACLAYNLWACRAHNLWTYLAHNLSASLAHNLSDLPSP